MAWIFAIVVIILALLIPAFGRVVLVIGGVLILGIVVLLLVNQQSEQRSKNLISSNQIQITDLRLGQSYGSYELSGQVKNNSSHELTGVTLDVVAYDCSTHEITASCETIGEDNSVEVSVNVPSNQVRAISGAYVSLYDMPAIRGNFLWSYKIVGITGK